MLYEGLLTLSVFSFTSLIVIYFHFFEKVKHGFLRHLQMNTSLRFSKYRLHQRPLFYEHFIAAVSTQPVLEYILQV